jgi:exodeoxyribonuclease-3
MSIWIGRRPRGQLKITTHNINGAKGRLDIVLRWIEEVAPDVVCLQEA